MYTIWAPDCHAKASTIWLILRGDILYNFTRQITLIQKEIQDIMTMRQVGM